MRSVAVQVVEAQPGFVEVGRQVDIAEFSKLLLSLFPCGWQSVSDVVEHDLAGDVIEFEVAASGQVGEAGLDVGLELSPSVRPSMRR